MSGYPLQSVTVPIEIGVVFRTWGIPYQCNCVGDLDLLLLSNVHWELERWLIVEDVGD